MSHHLLDPSDRAALQSLVTLAGTLGAGTIFALFFAGRKRAEYVVFEIFAIAAALASLATTAYFAIALLHQGEAISDRELAQTATPLVVAAFLLVLISVFARLRGRRQRLVALVPLAVAAVVAAVELASTSWTTTPEDGFLVALAILVVGLTIAAAVWGLERAGRRARVDRELARQATLLGGGYERGFEPLGAAIPRPAEEPDGPLVPRWTRRQRVYLDREGAGRLRAAVGESWDRCAEGELPFPSGAVVLRDLGLAGRGARLELTIAVPAAGEQHRRLTVEAGDHGLFDVTDHGLFQGF